MLQVLLVTRQLLIVLALLIARLGGAQRFTGDRFKGLLLHGTCVIILLVGHVLSEYLSCATLTISRCALLFHQRL